jgi:hypothetical protein
MFFTQVLSIVKEIVPVRTLKNKIGSAIPVRGALDPLYKSPALPSFGLFFVLLQFLVA